MGEERKGSTCGFAIKGVLIEGASAPCKGRSTGKKVKEGRRGEGGAHGQAIRSTARVEKKFGRRVKEESRGVLWQRGTRGSMSIRIRIVHERSDSDVCTV